MKWTNPGHQLDELGEQYLKVKNLYIFGVDEKAEKAIKFLEWLGVAEEFNIAFVLDITAMADQPSEFYGRRVVAFQTDLCDEVRAAPKECVVALPSTAQTAETEILKGLGCTNIFHLIHAYNRRDNFIQNFVCVWLMYKHGKLLSHWTNFITTQRCTLNCKGCINFNNSIKNPKDVPFEEFKEHVDALFSKFDYLYSFHFSGGEPLLVKELPEFVRYIEANYKDRIFEFFVISNCTLIPSNELLDAMKSMNAPFHLADYSSTVPYSKIEEVKTLLNKNNIHYHSYSAPWWFDLDVENTDNSTLSDNELEEHKDNCNQFCHEFAEKRIYSCCWQKYANRAGIGEIPSNDYIDIPSSSKMELLEFRQGYTHKGYVDFCKRCKGLGGGAEKIHSGIQIPKVSKKEYQESDNASVEMKVSICVPVYNTIKYLSRCVDSLLNQTYPNLEIILADDGSTDGSGVLCDEYAKLDSRVKVVHKENSGEASARNAALLAATGEYIMFTDSDDEYVPNAVELLINASKKDEADFVIGGYMEKEGVVVRFAAGHLQKYTAKEAAQRYLDAGCNYGESYILSVVNAKLFRRDIITGNHILFDERFVIGNDVVFICEYLKYARAVYNVYTPIYIYYKFHVSERLQGMAWFYPDAFFLFAYVADKMIKLAQFDENEYNKLVINKYMDLVEGLKYTIPNESHFESSLMPHLTSIIKEIDFLSTGAWLDLYSNSAENDNRGLPNKIISFLIANERFEELYALLKAISKANNIPPVKSDYVRLMVKNHANIKEKSAAEQEGLPTQPFGLMDDDLLVKQLGELISAITNSQQQADKYKSEFDSVSIQLKDAQAQLTDTETRYQAQLTDTETRYQAQLIDKETQYRMQLEEKSCQIELTNLRISKLEYYITAFEQSTSWRITKPFRVIMRLLRRK